MRWCAPEDGTASGSRPLAAVSYLHVIEIRIGSTLVLEDMSWGFKRPSMIDLKLGRSSFDSSHRAALCREEKDLDRAKALKMLKKDQNSTTASLGLRLAGMRLWHRTSPDESKVDPDAGRKWREEKLDRRQGKHLRQSELWLILSRFFRSCVQCHHILSQLEGLIAVLDLGVGVVSVSSSLLVAFESDWPSTTSPAPRLRLIDFAHVSYEHGADREVLFGLCTLRRLLLDVIQHVGPHGQ